MSKKKNITAIKHTDLYNVYIVLGFKTYNISNLLYVYTTALSQLVAFRQVRHIFNLVLTSGLCYLVK